MKASHRYGESDTKVLLAQGLADQKAELLGAMMFLGTLTGGTQLASEVMESAHDLPDPV